VNLDCIYFEGLTRQRPRALPRPRVAAPARSRPSEEEPEAARFLSFLFERLGVSLEAYRTKALHRRLPACLRFLRAKDCRSAEALLASRPDLVSAAGSVMLLGVTEFCRDRAVFDALQEIVLPALETTDRRSRVWSAACSEGRELYSIAALLEGVGLLERAELLGTDCRADAIARAARGEFSAESVAGLDPGWQRHFQREQNRVRVPASWRRAIRWKVGNLLTTTEPGPWDLLLWRNMAIYLTADAATRVWRNLIHELAPGGWLVCGKADHPPKHAGLARVAPCIYRKHA